MDKLRPDEPGYWMNETSGTLKPAVEAYLRGSMTGEEIALMRAYLRQWIMSPLWRGPGIESLRARISTLDTCASIHTWLDDAFEQGIDPL